MNIQKQLTTELVQYILYSFGFGQNIIYDTIGIYKEKYKTNYNIKIEYEENIVKKHPIYSASMKISESKLHVSAASLNYADEISYIALFKMDNFPLYGIKLDLTDGLGYSIFLISKSPGSWNKISMYDKIVACAGIEKLNDSGGFWEKDSPEEYYNNLVELAEM